MELIEGQILQTIRDVVRGMFNGAEVVLLGLALVVLALVVGKGVELLIRPLLRRLPLEAWGATVGADRVLSRGGVRRSPSDVIGRVVFVIVALFVAQVGAASLGLLQMAAMLGGVLGFLARILAAGLIVLLGGAAARYVREVVVQTAADNGVEYAQAIGTLVFGLLLFLVGVMAIGQLRIDTEAIWIVTACVLGAFALALGLSFGLGARETSRNIIAGYYARKVFEVGKPLELRGEQGVLKAITPTQTIIEQDGNILSVANAVLLEEFVKQR